MDINTFIFCLLSVVGVSLLSLTGLLFISTDKKILKKISIFFVSFAAGALFGDALIHLLPEAFNEIENHTVVSLITMGGLLLFFSLEKFLRWRHCHIIDDSNHHHPMVAISIVGDFFHNLVDGMIIGAAFLINPAIGAATAIAIALHEIPQEIGDFGILIHNGIPVKRAAIINLLSAASAIIGSLITLILGLKVTNIAPYFLPMAAGGFIYIAGSDLIPELHHECSAKQSITQLLLMIGGFLAMFALTLFE